MKLLRFTILLVSLSESAFALPNMVRLGYPNCVSCHVTPQGGGVLNPYGKGIDEAQDARVMSVDPRDGAVGLFQSRQGRTRMTVLPLPSML